jgi:hypothetical protein
MNNNNAYLHGYLDKSATDGKLEALLASLVKTFGALSRKAVDKTIEYGIPISLAAPILVGGGAGYLHSKATEPSEKDIQNAQKKLVAQELQEQLAELDRKKKLSTVKEPKGERSLHI